MSPEPEPSPIESAVLVPLFRDAVLGPMVVLVRRSEWGLHGGQLAFPGGKCEPADRSRLETALREAEEEIGLTRDRVELIEELPRIETRTTGFRIHPFLVRIERPAAWCADPREIAEVVETDVASLALPEAHGEQMLEFASWPGPRRVPYLQVGPHRLWGASYRILHPLLPRLLADFRDPRSSGT